MSQSTERRVFQFATGNVGSEMVSRLRDHPDLELVGFHCYSVDKVGRDAGEIVGVESLGALATGTVEEIIASSPDCASTSRSTTSSTNASSVPVSRTSTLAGGPSTVARSARACRSSSDWSTRLRGSRCGSWQMAGNTLPNWDIQGCYITTIKGDPAMVNRQMIFPADGQKIFDSRYFASLGMTITGMPALNAIGAVCDAAHGMVTSADLPLRAFAGRFGADR